MVSTQLKNISQIGTFPQVGGKKSLKPPTSKSMWPSTCVFHFFKRQLHKLVHFCTIKLIPHSSIHGTSLVVFTDMHLPHTNQPWKCMEIYNPSHGPYGYPFFFKHDIEVWMQFFVDTTSLEPWKHSTKLNSWGMQMSSKICLLKRP